VEHDAHLAGELASRVLIVARRSHRPERHERSLSSSGKVTTQSVPVQRESGRYGATIAPVDTAGTGPEHPGDSSLDLIAIASTEQPRHSAAPPGHQRLSRCRSFARSP